MTHDDPKMTQNRKTEHITRYKSYSLIQTHKQPHHGSVENNYYSIRECRLATNYKHQKSWSINNRVDEKSDPYSPSSFNLIQGISNTNRKSLQKNLAPSNHTLSLPLDYLPNSRCGIMTGPYLVVAAYGPSPCTTKSTAKLSLLSPCCELLMLGLGLNGGWFCARTASWS